jgi:hypothetical protein
VANVLLQFSAAIFVASPIKQVFPIVMVSHSYGVATSNDKRIYVWLEGVNSLLKFLKLQRH